MNLESKMSNTLRFLVVDTQVRFFIAFCILSGYNVSLEDLKNFRQLDSRFGMRWRI